jgi:feruloyl esterase
MRTWKPDKVVRKRLFTAVAMVAVAGVSAVTVIAAQAAGSAGRPVIATAGGTTAGVASAADTSYLSVGAAGVSRHTAAPIDTKALPARAALAPKYDCAAMAQQDFSQVKGAPTTILAATLATAKSATGTSYQYCDVSGIVYPQVQFELQLPTTTYSGRYLQEGCGGYCGNVGVNQPAATGQAGIDECVPLNNGEFALGQDDEGHIGGGGTEAWAIDDPMLKVDFGYRSEHVFALAAKAIIASFYGSAPAHSYYDGCSDGGREALMEAQRYPADFNGIIAGAPAFTRRAPPSTRTTISGRVTRSLPATNSGAR